MKKITLFLATAIAAMLCIPAATAARPSPTPTIEFFVEGLWSSDVATAWDRSQSVSVTPVASCAGVNCIHIVKRDMSPWTPGGISTGVVLGHAHGTADGGCEAAIRLDIENYLPNNYIQVAMHEAGHCMGLRHNDTQRSIMATYTGSDWMKLSGPTRADISNLTSLYP